MLLFCLLQHEPPPLPHINYMFFPPSNSHLGSSSQLEIIHWMKRQHSELIKFWLKTCWHHWGQMKPTKSKVINSSGIGKQFQLFLKTSNKHVTPACCMFYANKGLLMSCIHTHQEMQMPDLCHPTQPTIPGTITVSGLRFSQNIQMNKREARLYIIVVMSVTAQ